MESNRRQTEFESPEAKLVYDAKGLVGLARVKYGKENVTVRDALDLASRDEDDTEALRRAIAIEIKGKPEVMLNPAVEAAAPATELTPEQRWLGGFKARFDAAPHLHEDVQFADVEKALRADPDAMHAFAELDKNGHETNVFGEDAQAFEIGTCALDAASGHRNIVFDKAAQDLLGEGEQCNGNAADLAATIGVDLMDKDQTDRLIKKLNKNEQRLNSNSWDWLKTDAATRKRGLALLVNYNGVLEVTAAGHGVDGSFRAVRRVKKLGL